jgi:hypothetical protein
VRTSNKVFKAEQKKKVLQSVNYDAPIYLPAGMYVSAETRTTRSGCLMRKNWATTHPDAHICGRSPQQQKVDLPPFTFSHLFGVFVLFVYCLSISLFLCHSTPKNRLKQNKK